MTGNGGGQKSPEERISELESWRELWVDPKLEAAAKVEPRVSKLESFQRLVLSIGALIGATGGFFAAEIKRRIGFGP